MPERDPAGFVPAAEYSQLVWVEHSVVEDVQAFVFVAPPAKALFHPGIARRRGSGSRDAGQTFFKALNLEYDAASCRFFRSPISKPSRVVHVDVTKRLRELIECLTMLLKGSISREQLRGFRNRQRAGSVILNRPDTRICHRADDVLCAPELVTHFLEHLAGAARSTTCQCSFSK